MKHDYFSAIANITTTLHFAQKSKAVIERNLKKDFYSDIDVFNSQPLVIQNQSGKLHSTEKQIFHDYLKKQKETLLRRVKGFDARLNDMQEYIKEDFINDNVPVALFKKLEKQNTLEKFEETGHYKKFTINDNSVIAEKISRSDYVGSKKRELASKYLRTLYVEANLGVSLCNEIDKQLKY